MMDQIEMVFRMENRKDDFTLVVTKQSDVDEVLSTLNRECAFVKLGNVIVPKSRIIKIEINI